MAPSDKLTEHQVDAPHNYNQQTREHVYRFLDQQAFGRADDGKEKSAPIEKLGDMLALMNHPLPAHALNYDGLFADWQRVARAQADATEDLAVLRARLARALAHAVIGARVARCDGRHHPR